MSRRSGAQRIGAIAAVAVLLTAPFGGLAEAEDDVEPLTLGDTYDLGPFEVRLDQVLSLPDLEPALFTDPGRRVLVLDVTVTNPTDRAESVGLLTQAWGGDGTGAVPWSDEDSPRLRAVSVNDATELSPSEPINPGQTVRLVLVLQQESAWRPEDLRLELYGFPFVEDDPGTLDPNQWDPSDPFLVAAGPVEAEVEQ